MTDVMQGLKSLLDEVRQARLEVATLRAHGTAERYPEVRLEGVEPLGDAELIREALRRELAHQLKVMGDVRRD